MSNRNRPLGGLASWIGRMEPVARKRMMILGGAAGFLLLAFLIITATSDSVPIAISRPKKIDYTLFGGHKPREVTLEVLGGQLDKMKDDYNEMRFTISRQEERLKQLNEQLAAKAAEAERRARQLDEHANDLFKRLESRSGSPSPLPAKPNPADAGLPSAATTGGAPVEGQGVPATIGTRIKTVTAEGGVSGNGAKGAPGSPKITEFANIRASERKGGSILLPAGAILSGTLITGLDAPTANQSRQEPFPVLLRIKHDAILPNRYRLDVKECFLIGSGYGDLSSERAYLRSERMSCVKKDGSLIESAIDAYSVGEDGKAGVRGRVVSKNGQLIGNALLSGAIAGLSQAFAPQSVQSLNTLVQPGQRQVYQYPSAHYVGGQAFAGSIKGASAQIAAYYLEMAKNIMPVIEVDAGRKVDFVLIRGLAMKPRTVESLEPGAAAKSTAQSAAGFGREIISSVLPNDSGRGGTGGQFPVRRPQEPFPNDGNDLGFGADIYDLSGG